MDIALKLGVAAGALQFAGYIAYNISLVKRGVKPNTASWLIWTLGLIPSAASYVAMSKGSAEDILPIVCAISCVLTFFHILTRGERKPIDREEWIIVALDSGIIVVWIISGLVGLDGKATIVVNLLFQFSTILSFRPILKEVWGDRKVETKLPWILWSCAYGVEITVLAVQGSSWNEWVYPFVCLPLHAAIAILANPRR